MNTVNKQVLRVIKKKTLFVSTNISVIVLTLATHLANRNDRTSLSEVEVGPKCISPETVFDTYLVSSRGNDLVRVDCNQDEQCPIVSILLKHFLFHKIQSETLFK